MNPLWVDARDYLTSQGQQITTGGLNQAMNLLATNPQLRPSAVKAGGGAAGIAAGLGAPTDQIVSTPLAPPGITQTPLPPPVSPSPASGGKHGASSGKRTAGGTSASGKTVKDVPGGVGNYAAAGGQDKSNQYGLTSPAQTPMGGYTPPAPPSQPSSPVGTAQAGTGAEDPGFLSHLMGGDYNKQLLAGGAGLGTLLGALLMHKGLREGGGVTEPVTAAPPEPAAAPGGTPRPGFRLPSQGGAPVDPASTLVGGTFGDPLSGTPTSYGSSSDYGASSGRDTDSPGFINQSVTPYSGEAPATMPPQLAGLVDEMVHGQPVRSSEGGGVPQGSPAPGSLEEIIAQLTNQTPYGQSPPGPAFPSGPPVPVGKPNNSPIGVRRGTQTPYSGAVPPGVQSGIPDPIMQLLQGRGR